MARILLLSKRLLGYWIVSLVLMSMTAFLIAFLGAPVGLMVITRTISVKLLPDWDDIYKLAKVVLMAAFWSGLILWAKEEFFTKK